MYMILECKILNTNERNRPPSVTFMLTHTTDVLDFYDDLMILPQLLHPEFPLVKSAQKI